MVRVPRRLLLQILDAMLRVQVFAMAGVIPLVVVVPVAQVALVVEAVVRLVEAVVARHAAVLVVTIAEVGAQAVAMEDVVILAKATAPITAGVAFVVAHVVLVVHAKDAVLAVMVVLQDAAVLVPPVAKVARQLVTIHARGIAGLLVGPLAVHQQNKLKAFI